MPVEKVLQFHRVTPNFQFCGTWNTPNQFETFLRFLHTNDIDVILPGEKANGVILTFDDGERNIYEYAFPILKKFKMRAIVFLVVQYIGKKNIWDVTLTGRRHNHLDWHQIKEMKKWGIEFGSHTMTHRNLTKLKSADIKHELFESRKILEKEIGECDSISYPFNKVNSDVIKTAARAGYTYGFGGNGSSNLCLRKDAMYIIDTISSFRTKIFEKPRLLYRYERIKQTAINYFTIATMVMRRGN